MIRVRDDDVLVGSQKFDSVGRFKAIHEIIVSYGALHVPAILTTEIQEYPEIYSFIRDEYKAGRMEPQWHGMSHVDYANKTYDGIVEDIRVSQRFFLSKFGVRFSIFYTPWGANDAHIDEACRAEGITMVDCLNGLRCVHISKNPGLYRGKDIEILIHWWEGNRRLRNALKVLNQ